MPLYKTGANKSHRHHDPRHGRHQLGLEPTRATVTNGMMMVKEEERETAAAAAASIRTQLVW